MGVLSGTHQSKGTEALGSALSQFVEETLGSRRFSWTEVWLGPFDPSVSELKKGFALTIAAFRNGSFEDEERFHTDGGGACFRKKRSPGERAA